MQQVTTSPCLLESVIKRGDWGEVLVILMSPRVRVTDDLFADTHRIFEEHCVTIHVHEKYRHAEMFKKEAIEILGEIHQDCPGVEHEHICKGDNLAVAALFTI